jgi:hypothetical protein
MIFGPARNVHFFAFRIAPNLAGLPPYLADFQPAKHHMKITRVTLIAKPPVTLFDSPKPTKEQKDIVLRDQDERHNSLSPVGSNPQRADR